MGFVNWLIDWFESQSENKQLAIMVVVVLIVFFGFSSLLVGFTVGWF